MIWHLKKRKKKKQILPKKFIYTLFQHSYIPII